MLITLLIFEIVLMGLTIFTTHMVEHKFESIKMSLGMYCNKRVYKTEADIHFIEMVITDYKRLCSDTDEEPDLPSAISLKLHKEFIGRFSYMAVMNIAIKVRHLMWGIFAAEILVAWINQEVQKGQNITIIFLSLLLTVMMCFYGIIKGLEEKQENLVDEITHYIKNVYPAQIKKQEKLKEAQNKKREEEAQHTKCLEKESLDEKANLTDSEMITKESEDTTMKEQENPPEKETNLSAEDIAQLLGGL